MNVFKKLLAGFLILPIITSIGLWFLAKTINPEVVKNYVNSQLSFLTEQETKVEGEISWELIPRPGIKITKIQIGKENTNYLAKLENLRFNLKITPLLRGKLVFNELNVDGFKIYINSDTFFSPAKIIKSSGQGEPKTSFAEQFAIERFLLAHGQVTILQNQKLARLSGLQIGADQFNLQQNSFPLQFKTNLEIATAENEKLLKTHISFKGSTSLSTSLMSNPLTALKNIPLEGQLSLQNTRIKHFKIDKIGAHTKTKTGVISLNPLTFNLYGGESIGDLHYEFESQKFLLNQTVTNLDSAILIDDLFNKNLIKGSMDFSIHLQANLQNTNWQDDLIGNGNLTIKEGSIESINLAKITEETCSRISNLVQTKKFDINHLLELGQFNESEFFNGSSNFKLLTFQYLLQNSKLESNSFVLQTDKLQLKGEGNLNLKNNHLDSQLFAKIILQDSKIDKMQQLLCGNFPLLVKGDLTSPTILPDLNKINPLVAKILFKNTLIKPVQKIEETLNSLTSTAKPPLL